MSPQTMIDLTALSWVRIYHTLKETCRYDDAENFLGSLRSRSSQPSDAGWLNPIAWPAGSDRLAAERALSMIQSCENTTLLPEA